MFSVFLCFVCVGNSLRSARASTVPYRPSSPMAAWVFSCVFRQTDGGERCGDVQQDSARHRQKILWSEHNFSKPVGATSELEDHLSKVIFCFLFLFVGYRWVYFYQPAIDLLPFRSWCGWATLRTGDWPGEASEDPDGCSWALQWAVLWHEPGAVWRSHATHVSWLENNKIT